MADFWDLLLARKISGGGGADVSGVTATAGDVDTGKVFVNSSGQEVEGTSTAKTDLQNLNNEVKGLIDGTVTSFTIPEGTTRIRSYAFNRFTTLENINIPELKLLKCTLLPTVQN